MTSSLHDILQEAITLSASDVHLKVDEPPFFRVRGELQASNFPKLAAETLQAIAREILPEHLEKNADSANEMDFSHIEEGVGRFRVNMFLSHNTPTLAMRHVKTEVPSLTDLHLPAQVTDVLQINSGIIMVCGATSSGKSSTLAAMINHYNTTERMRIITIEDPVEYVFSDVKSVITQREVGLDTPSFNTALKHVLRQDPDLIMIGEMRDQESLAVALSAAETGHIVLSTLHSTTADQAINRILSLFPAEEREQIRLAVAANLKAILCQRLVPAMAGGMLPAVEILINTPTVHKLLQENKLETLSAAMETGKEDGMQTFNQALFKLIKSGQISEAEGLAYSPRPESLRMNLQGIFLDSSRRILGS